MRLYVDNLYFLTRARELRYNMIKYDEELERRFKEYEENTSMQDFLREKFGTRAVELAKVVFGIKN